MKVFINPGHKIGLDPGACSPSGLQEAVVAMEVGKLVKMYLEAVGIETAFLQSNSLNGEDEDYDNPSICDTANASDADLFVSIHCNAAANPAAEGTETLVYSFGGKAHGWANCIQDQLIDTLGTVDRGVKERKNLAVLKYTDMPAVLVEIAFISNPDDEEILRTRQDDIARAIARGITDYM